MKTRDAVALLCVAEGVLDARLTRGHGRFLLGSGVRHRMLDALYQGGTLVLEHGGAKVEVVQSTGEWQARFVEPDDFDVSLARAMRLVGGWLETGLPIMDELCRLQTEWKGKDQ